MTTTRAMVLVNPGRIVEQTIPLPAPLPGEVLVRISCCTVCESDRRSFRGERAVARPTILGHEITGVIEALGGEVRAFGTERPLRVGERITWAVVASCGSCFFCRRGLPQKCPGGVKYGHGPLRGSRGLVGGFAEHCMLAPSTSIFPLPDDLPDVLGAIASCAGGTAVAARDAAEPQSGEEAVILGAGMLGLLLCGLLTERGVRVTVVEPDAARRDLALGWGAERCVSRAEEVDAKKSSEAGGFDSVFECSGARSAQQDALKLARIGGVVVLAGAVAPLENASWNPERIVRRCLRLQGVHNYAPAQLGAALDFITRNRERFDERLVATRVPLTEVARVLSERRGAIRTPLLPGLQASSEA